MRDRTNLQARYDMNIPIQCPGCGQTLQIPEQYAGQTGKCQHCGGAITVPTPATAVFAAAPVPVPAAQPETGTAKKAFIYGCFGCGGVAFAIFLALVGLGVLSGIGSSDTIRRTVESAAPEDTITLDEFNRIQVGMTMEEVAGIVGSWGQLDSENSFGAGTQFATATAMYSFNGARTLSRAGVMVQNGRVMQKHQFGLDH